MENLEASDYMASDALEDLYATHEKLVREFMDVRAGSWHLDAGLAQLLTDAMNESFHLGRVAADEPYWIGYKHGYGVEYGEIAGYDEDMLMIDDYRKGLQEGRTTAIDEKNLAEEAKATASKE